MVVFVAAAAESAAVATTVTNMKLHGPGCDEDVAVEEEEERNKRAKKWWKKVHSGMELHCCGVDRLEINDLEALSLLRCNVEERKIITS